LEAGANPNAVGLLNWSPLHEAAVQGSAKIVKLLLRAGADPKTERCDGATAEYLADDPEVKGLLS